MENVMKIQNFQNVSYPLWYPTQTVCCPQQNLCDSIKRSEGIDNFLNRKVCVHMVKPDSVLLTKNGSSWKEDCHNVQM